MIQGACVTGLSFALGVRYVALAKASPATALVGVGAELAIALFGHTYAQAILITNVTIVIAQTGLYAAAA